MTASSRLDQITAALDQLESEEQITVLWACESGSRAWGFESATSDYDVRFVYLRRTKDYLRVSPLRDVIERPIAEDLDLSGWDLSKALGLFRKSNPSLLEWLQSPIVYRQHGSFQSALLGLVPQYFSPRACMGHYLSVAERNRRNYLMKDQIRLKRYFYMIRPILACHWLERRVGLPPLAFQTLVSELLPEEELRTVIDGLWARKRNGEGLDLAPPIPILSEFISSEMKRLSFSLQEGDETQPWETLDELFRNLLLETGA